jgi:site-specific recombinase XerD
MLIACSIIQINHDNGGWTMMRGLVDEYIAERVARGELHGNSPIVIRSTLNSFATHTGGRPMEDLCERDIETWLATQDFRPATRNGMVNKLKPFIRWLVARDHIPKDFTALLKAPKVPPGMARYLEAEQVRDLVRACRTPRDRLIVLLMVHLGLRRIEVSRIDMEDIDFNVRLISVRGKNGQGEVTRSLPITDEVLTAMEKYLADAPTDAGPLVRQVLFDRRMNPKQITDLISALMLEVGIKKMPRDGMSGHALRHSCAQSLIDSGVDIRLVQAALGHHSVTTTEGYLRRQPPGLRDAMAGRVYT